MTDSEKSEENKKDKNNESSEDEEEEEKDDKESKKTEKNDTDDDNDDSQSKSIEEEFQGINLKEEAKGKKILPGKKKGIKLRGIAPGYKDALKKEIKKQKKLKKKSF